MSDISSHTDKQLPRQRKLPGFFVFRNYRFFFFLYSRRITPKITAAPAVYSIRSVFRDVLP